MELLAFLHWNVGFIRKETAEIDSAPDVKARVIQECDRFTEFIERYQKDKDADALTANLRKGFQEFDDIIKEIDGNPREERMNMLLMTHVADMMAATRPRGTTEKQE